jgi:hypothetical protein
MKTNCFIYLCILLLAVTGCREEDGLIPREAYPDLLFEQYMLQNFDTDGDGLISFREAKAVREIDCSNMRITSLKGIQYFTSLETLNCSGNDIKALDLAQNTALQSLNCSENSLNDLDLTKNTVLRSLVCNSCVSNSVNLSKNTALEYLYFSNNYGIKSLDLSGATNLRDLYCESNSLTSLNLSSNANLQVLSCNWNAISSLDLSGLTSLRELLCIHINNGSTMTITGLDNCRSLEKLNLSGVTAEKINLAGSSLKEFNYAAGAFQPSFPIDLSGCDKLEVFRFTSKDETFQNINLAGCTALNTIEISRFESIDVSSLTSLRKLVYQYGNVDISKNTELEEVFVRNILGDITNLRKLRTLDFQQIKNVETLNLSNQTVLENLRCAVLDIPMNLSHCKALRTFNIYHLFYGDYVIKVDAVDLKGLPVLESIVADNLTDKVSLNIENCPALKTVTSNELATLNISGCASLEEMKFKCKAFNINNCPNVISINCSGSPVGTLHLDAYTKLESLSCSNCSLTELDLRKNKNVIKLSCSNNPGLRYIELTRDHVIPNLYKDNWATLRYWDE